MKNCLPYDEVPKARYTKWSDTHPLFIEELKRRSSERVQNNPEFHYVMEDMERLRHKLDDNRISLNEDARRKELQDDKLRKETRSKDRLARHDEEPSIYRLTLDTVDKPNLQLIMFPGKLAAAKANGVPTKVSPEAAPDDESDVIGARRRHERTRDRSRARRDLKYLGRSCRSFPRAKDGQHERQEISRAAAVSSLSGERTRVRVGNRRLADQL